MLDQDKKQQILNLIQTSTLLSSQEKTEWLAMLDLMNDKQISELEEILGASSKPVTPEIPPTPNRNDSNPEPAKAVPSLSHIANVPNKLSFESFSDSNKPKPAQQSKPLEQRQQAPQPTALKNFPKPNLGNLAPRPLQTKPLSPNPTKPVGAFLHTKSPGQQNPPPISKPPLPKSATIQATPIPQPIPSAPLPKIETLEQVANLSAKDLHSYSRKQLFESIYLLTQTHGYFAVLSYLEKSALYKDYLSYGRIKLSGHAQQPPISQEEFEFVTDLLQALKINRV